MNQIIPFTYEGNNVRTITTEDGTPLFCGKDVANQLDSSPRNPHPHRTHRPCR